MARLLHDHDLPALPDRATPRRTYPWAEWCDGQRRELQAGTDFTGSAGVFRNYLYVVARARGLSVSTRKVCRDDGEFLQVRFRPTGRP
jgi:hypothetical protein